MSSAETEARTSETVASSPAERPAPQQSEPTTSTTGRRRGRPARWLFRLAVLALLAVNGWRVYQDFQPQPDLRQINALVRQQRLGEAESALRSYLQRAPRDDTARFLLARVLVRQSRDLESAEQLHKVPYWSPRKREAQFLEGATYHRLGMARPAEEAWNACIAYDPLHPAPDLHYMAAVEQLMELYALEHRWEEARDLCWDTYERVVPSEKPKIVIMLMRTYVERINVRTRLTKLRRYLSADPKDNEALLAIALAEHELADNTRALERVRLFLERRPEDPRGWRLLLDILHDLGDREAMAEAVAQLPASADEDPAIWRHRGQVFEDTDRLEDAARAYRNAVELDPFEAESHYRLARILRRLGEDEEARHHLERSRELRDARGQLRQAYADYYDAVSASLPDPETVETTRERLAGLCRTLGMTDLAEVL